jgi:hypothetical protein
MFISDPKTEIFHPGSRAKKIPDLGSGSASKNLSILALKTVSKLQDPDFFHPGSRIQGSNSTGSRVQIRSTAYKNLSSPKSHTAATYAYVSKNQLEAKSFWSVTSYQSFLEVKEI